MKELRGTICWRKRTSKKWAEGDGKVGETIYKNIVEEAEVGAGGGQSQACVRKQVQQ